MFKLDNAFLEELGLGALPPIEKNKMLAHIYETLEMRVGVKLAEQMSNEQLDEFERYINAQDEAGALKWLETNFPDYKQVVAQQLEMLKQEIIQVAPSIVQQALEAAAMQPAVQQPQTAPAAGQYSQPGQISQPAYAPQPVAQQQYAPQFNDQAQQPPQPTVTPAYPPMQPSNQPMTAQPVMPPSTSQPIADNGQQQPPAPYYPQQ